MYHLPFPRAVGVREMRYDENVESNLANIIDLHSNTTHLTREKGGRDMSETSLGGREGGREEREGESESRN